MLQLSSLPPTLLVIAPKRDRNRKGVWKKKRKQDPGLRSSEVEGDTACYHIKLSLFHSFLSIRIQQLEEFQEGSYVLAGSTEVTSPDCRIWGSDHAGRMHEPPELST